MNSRLPPRANKAPGERTYEATHSTPGTASPLHAVATTAPFSEPPFSAAPNLPPLPKCCMNRCCEKVVFQRSETAGGAKPHGRRPQGSPQSTGGGGASAAGFTGRLWREMAHYQFKERRPCPVETDIAWAFPSSSFRKSSIYATWQDSRISSSAARRSIIGLNVICPPNRSSNRSSRLPAKTLISKAAEKMF